ncbi:phosphoribosylaminoimidazolesuccinocarboxamide synthase [Beggiatoa leptomitoformis]|uniref:Phosphoribosylaminoimidazole-succinocarboxamide synthase n=1 Tax=Beggiatoa leptomitoformis TaxID=288004 RepID=A0A2N9YCR2_9GAMM|nr:phosphoribosylaminoimidazolesuccinocarboxamide synthase [Beggiatoa leptomitoformis]ALG66494.1 phosphoribosylaminoimidazolesuccinocarboxamide synthase [Beggiatoa leptomitoformis]AUI68214.1 phosphoribosylaminoimidazolesuccinocarboxamide synthase [Beggiatoa leptomitoformis]
MTTALFESHLTQLPLLHRGKVRDIYGVDDQHLLIVASDRLSAFDVILPTPIPEKGKILTTLSNFWFAMMRAVIPNHLTDISLEQVLTNPAERAQVEGRAIVTRKLTPLPVEAIVRGYVAGSGWKDYQKTGAICGIRLPDGLPQAARLAEPIFTPSSKAAVGQHDENISLDAVNQLIGKDLAAQVQAASIAIYCKARDYALTKGIIIADTKFEFGVDAAGNLVLIDEILTPDSSRFWLADEYQTGISPPSFDKQFVRDYLETLDWNKQPPAPVLPEAVLAKTAEKYREAQQRLMG